MKFAIAGDTDSIRETLQRMAAEADAENAKPRATAETRDERGNSLLALAAWHGHYDTAELLLTHYKTCDPLLEETERKVFQCRPNTKDFKVPVSVHVLFVFKI